MDKIRKNISAYKEGARRGDRESQYWLGYCYFHGQGVEVNWPRAARYMKLAAERGSGKAAYQLGFCYSAGKGVKRNLKLSKEWYQKSLVPLQHEAEDNNDIESLGLLGHAYLFGHGGLEKNEERAVNLFECAAKEENPIGMNLLAGCYCNSYGVKQDDHRAFELYKQSADQGEYMYAQNDLGHMYLQGRGVEKDEKEAVRLFQDAAQKGSFDAICSLGWCYDKGLGVEQDYKMAAKFYDQAAKNGGDFKALNNLGYLYLFGLGVDKNPRMAVMLFRESCRLGNDGMSQSNLGYAYENGLGVKKNLKLAAMWYHKSFQAGLPREQVGLDRFLKTLKSKAHTNERCILKALAYCYRNGAGVEQNLEIADTLLRQEAIHRVAFKGIMGDTSTAEPFTERRQCVCCEVCPPSAILVHGESGHSGFCLPCAFSCSTNTNSCDSCCPICRAPIDKVILQLPSTPQTEPGEPKQRTCLICGGDYDNNTVVLHGGNGHTCEYCYECACQEMEKKNECSICQKPIENVIRQYRG